jgi:hypothetical protein
MVDAVNHKGDYHCDEQSFHVCSLTEHEPDATDIARQAVGGWDVRRPYFSTVTTVATSTCRQPAVTDSTAATATCRPASAGRVGDRTASSRTARAVYARRTAVTTIASHCCHGKRACVGVGQTASPAVGNAPGTDSIENCLPTRTRHGQAAFGVPASPATAAKRADSTTPPATAATTPRL